MKVDFSWKRISGCSSPSCSSDSLNRDGVSPICCLLMDDGGQGHLSSIPWIDEGVRRIASVKDSTLEHVNWSREAWGAELWKDKSKIYSLYDESVFEMIDTHELMLLLLAWKEFVQGDPKVGGA
ncbi:hypothetical protein [Massilia scottii]|uniref:hypothetical protein n=1 Tax=Massilia scottii TaxID=3057166 RepID=UPI002796A74E|nr:hypothetical protein [Massilia sp. CCM 9029]MDQ1835617.1 hypothetical protein [Massilia sp. CCM 9029]